MTTLAAVPHRAGLGAGGALDAQVDVPVLTGAQCQGDLIALPRPLAEPATTPLPLGGVDLVPGDTGANTHTLLSWDGPACRYDVRDPGPSGLVLGVLTVPVGATAYLVHSEEHGANAFGPGSYEIRRQRERADVVRRVGD
ncbi:hypothetical protein [Pseudonocardia lacus]|uniref:hypothetical protein n=1 Tax=Pseudonocardia lacus TaxID=2835865 RepID=UPI001BDCC9F5|nr:hypothetical protein [Pseudonocardia lacus]